MQTEAPAVMSRIQDKFKALKRPPTLLVIEDDSGYVELLRRWFQGLSYLCVYALTGEQGLAKLKEKVFDLIWVDLKLPGISDMELITAIKQISKNHFAIIVVSGHLQDTKTVAALMALGVIIVSTKPETQAELTALMAAFNL